MLKFNKKALFEGFLNAKNCSICTSENANDCTTCWVGQFLMLIHLEIKSVRGATLLCLIVLIVLQKMNV